MSIPLIETRNLKKYFDTPRGMLHAVDGVNISIQAGSTLGVVGESGCGKSTLGRTILQLIKPTSGEVLYNGQNIAGYNERQMAAIRRDMQIIFQDPFSSLNPRMTVRDIIAEPIRVCKLCHGNAEIYEPKFIVCDEPVSALDVSIQAQILNLLMDLQSDMGLTYMFITHDLSVVKHISNEIAVMYLGQCVERVDSDRLFENPLHPYTKALLAAIPIPKLMPRKRGSGIIKGEVSNPIDPKPGCRFASRCPNASERCLSEELRLVEAEPGHFVACALYE